MANSPQFERTQKAITQAFISLLKVKPFEKITVQDILDETPVTRSTFYQHFHDKYEIAEKMQEEFFAAQLAIRAEILTNPKSLTPVMQKLTLQNKELMDALDKVHTEKVNLRKSLAKTFEAYYLQSNSRPTSEAEAQVYAQAQIAFLLSNKKQVDFSFDYMNDIFISAFLMLIGIPKDEELRDIIKKHIPPKF